MAYDYNQLRYEELESISEFCHTLDEGQWDTQSLCEGWRVRDVIAHMSVGYTTGFPTMIVKLARFGFNVPKASKAESVAFASSMSHEQLLAVFDSIYKNKTRKGITHVIRSSEGLLDHVVHHEDIRRPLGQMRTVPEERLLAALDFAPRLKGFVGSKSRAAGLRFSATDVDWRHGSDGPEVTGTGEALLMALAGRTAVLGELGGDGVPIFRARVAT